MPALSCARIVLNVTRIDLRHTDHQSLRRHDGVTMAPCRLVILSSAASVTWGFAEGIASARRVTHPHAGGVTMPLSSSFTDEGGGFASFLHQVQKSYVPERDLDGRKFDKAMGRLRARLEETTTARAELAGDLDLRRRDDEDRLVASADRHHGIRFLVVAGVAGGRVSPSVALELLADRRRRSTTSTPGRAECSKRSTAGSPDARRTAAASSPATSSRFADGTRTFPLTIEGNSPLRDGASARPHQQRDRPAGDAPLRRLLPTRGAGTGVGRGRSRHALRDAEIRHRIPALPLVGRHELPRARRRRRGDEIVDRTPSRADSRCRAWRGSTVPRPARRHPAGIANLAAAAALARRPEATFERTASSSCCAKPILNEIRNLSSIQFSANIDMYLGFRLRAAERLVQTFPHGPAERAGAGHGAARLRVRHPRHPAVHGQDRRAEPGAASAVVHTAPDGAPSTGAVAATVTFFRLIEDAARDLSACAPELFGWLDQLYGVLDDLPAEVSSELLAFTPRSR